MVPGTKQRLTAEVRSLAEKLFDANYWRLKYERIHNGTEHPKIEQILLAYAFGEPPREVHQTGLVVHLGPMQALQALQQQDNELIDTESMSALNVSPVSASMAALESNRTDEQNAGVRACETPVQSGV